MSGWRHGAALDHAGRWRGAGASHISVNTMGAGLSTVDGHLDALARVADALDLTTG